MTDNQKQAIARCETEIAEARRLLVAGHPEVEGLCMALSDWSEEKRMIEAEVRGAVAGWVTVEEVSG
jgi:hypothetical protein